MERAIPHSRDSREGHRSAGEAIAALRHRFRLIPEIPIHHALRS
jgi:hypothetical protein